MENLMIYIALMKINKKYHCSKERYTTPCLHNQPG
jgi:hypothetical protein